MKRKSGDRPRGFSSKVCEPISGVKSGSGGLLEHDTSTHISVFLFACVLHAETYQGKVVDPSGAAIAGADGSGCQPLGVVAQRG